MPESRFRRLCWIALSLAATAAACGGGAGSDAATEYREAPSLTLAEEYTFCTDETTQACQLGERTSVNVASGGGALVWADGGPIARFDTSGAPAIEYGRPGSGPGEYRRAVSVHEEADGRVVITDFGPPRRLVFSAEGTPIATHVDAIEYGARWMQAGARGFEMLVDPPAAPGDSVLSEFRLLRDTLPPLVVATIPGVREASAEGLSPIRGFFADRLRWAVETDTSVLIATGPSLRVVRHYQDGRRASVVDVPQVGNRAVTPEDVREQRERLRESIGPIPSQMRQPLEQSHDAAAENAASFHQFAADLRALTDGAFMLRELETHADSARWTIFTRDGEPIGQLRLPADAKVAGGTRDRLLLVIPDARDVPVVAWYRVTGPG